MGLSSVDICLERGRECEEMGFYQHRSRNPSLEAASLDATSLNCFRSGTAISASLRLGIDMQCTSLIGQ